MLYSYLANPSFLLSKGRSNECHRLKDRKFFAPGFHFIRQKCRPNRTKIHTINGVFQSSFTAIQLQLSEKVGAIADIDRNRHGRFMNQSFPTFLVEQQEKAGDEPINIIRYQTPALMLTGKYHPIHTRRPDSFNPVMNRSEFVLSDYLCLLARCWRYLAFCRALPEPCAPVIYFFFLALVFTLPASSEDGFAFRKTMPPPEIISSMSVMIVRLGVLVMMRVIYPIHDCFRPDS